MSELFKPMNDPRLYAVSRHSGYARSVARGIRALCRPRDPAWGGRALPSEDECRAFVVRAFSSLACPGEVVTWVPGHDGSNGPGHFVAQWLGGLWRLPVRELFSRSVPLPSAHDCSVRPTLLEQVASLAVLGDCIPLKARVVVVDNVVASGSSMLGCLAVAERHAIRVSALACVTVDMSKYLPYLVGGRRHKPLPVWLA